MDLNSLAEKYQAFELADISPFQRRARILQSMWREENSIPCGEHRAKNKVRGLGSRIPMPRAEELLENFLADPIREVVKSQVCNSKMSVGKLFGKPRIFNDLLSSQPLCFNLFGELTYDLSFASAVVNDLTRGRFTEVISIDFEMSPGRGEMRYLGDSSAFDVLLECRTATEGRGFIGIEVKYHENLKGTAGGHKARYDEVAEIMGCFDNDRNNLKSSPLQQIWRDHLLVGIAKIEGGYEDAMFVMLYPRENMHVSGAAKEYLKYLVIPDSFASWTLEDFFRLLQKYSQATWMNLFYNRYLAFEKIDAMLNAVD
jgi:hypothetical protein